MKVLSTLLVAVLVLCGVEAIGTGAGTAPRCKGSNNTITPITAAPTLVKTVKNGKMYLAGEGNDTFAIVHVWGTPYEQGYAQGQLRADDLKGVWPKFDKYIAEQIQKSEKELPQWLIDLIAEFGAPFLLQETYKKTKPFTPQRYIDEMQGIADGAGIDVEVVQNINMFPELTKAACTIVGANHNATPGHQIQHLRGLDFSPSCPIKDYSQITVYHDDSGIAVANVGWAAMIGSLTGISNVSIGIGEKVWLDHAKGVSGTHGQPWMFILRDVLLTRNIDEALATIQNANRTCAIHVGIGDSTTNKFRGVKMSKDDFLVYNWSSIDYPQHPILPGIMYWDKHEQPTGSWCLSDLLTKYYGAITADILAFAIAPVSMTGNMQSVAFDYEAQVAWVANARRTWDTTGSLGAFARTYTRVDLNALWNETRS